MSVSLRQTATTSRMRLHTSILLAALALCAGCRPTTHDHLQAARTALFERQPEEALVHYRRALEALRRDETPAAPVLKARALKGAADTYYLHQRKIAEAVSVYRQLIEECPESPEALLARVTLAAILESHYRDLRGAIAALTEAIARNPPESAELNYKVARLYFELQDYPQAEVEGLKLSQRYETSAFVDDALYLRAQAIAMIEGRKADAARAFQDFTERLSDSELAPHALFELGKVRVDLGEDERAIEAWVEALPRHPQPAVIQDAIARTRRRLANTRPSRVGDRVAAFDRAVQLPLPPKPPKTSLEAVGGDTRTERDPFGE